MNEETIKNEDFRTRLMDIQTGLLELCMDITDEKADKIYVYCSMEGNSTMFNAFFEVDGKTVTIDELNIEDGLSWDFLKTGTYDLVDMSELFEEYNAIRPTEIKMFYDVKTRHFNANYQYDPICTLESGLDESDVFMDWYNEVKRENNESD